MEREDLYQSSYEAFGFEPESFSIVDFISTPEEDAVGAADAQPDIADLLHFDAGSTTFTWEGAAVLVAHSETGERQVFSYDRLPGAERIDLREGVLFVDGAAVGTFGGPAFKLDEAVLTG